MITQKMKIQQKLEKGIHHLKGSKYYENGNRFKAIKNAILNAEPDGL